MNNVKSPNMHALISYKNCDISVIETILELFTGHNTQNMVTLNHIAMTIELLNILHFNLRLEWSILSIQILEDPVTIQYFPWPIVTSNFEPSLKYFENFGLGKFTVTFFFCSVIIVGSNEEMNMIFEYLNVIS